MLTVQKVPGVYSTRLAPGGLSKCEPVALALRGGFKAHRVSSSARVSCSAKKTHTELVDNVESVERIDTTDTTSADAGSPRLAWTKTMALFAAAVLLTSVGQVDDAMAARSGGRVGGSSFSSARMRSGGARSAPSVSSGGVRNYNYYSAPPLISPYGGYGMFGGGLVMPFPIFGLGGLFNIMVLLFMVNVAVSVVQGLTNSRSREEDEDERW